MGLSTISQGRFITIAPDLWIATQPLKFLGIEVGSRMTVVRLTSGELVLISPIELTESDRHHLDQLGTVAHIIAPNRFHYLSLQSTQASYPNATTWGVSGLSPKCPNVRIDQQLDSPGTIEAGLAYQPFRGVCSIMTSGIQLLQETVFFHRPSHTLIVTDSAFNFDSSNSLGTRFAAQILGSYNTLKPSRLEKWGSRDKIIIERDIRQILMWDFDRVIPGHGSVVETGGKEQFQAGYEWFLERSLN
ncbi:MAG: DUF4336 domain-containing protein [Merismopedia sp. SIO2A8]|nr:DUF4336 domain-containing protein [Symploca sp. SIO2B6]NET52055.1 DUF4336 domain-containing protein [Merismopedia sp. SIO2A8]